MKPILACDVNLKKVRYPVMILPKIDGVRGLNIDCQLVGRSGKKFKNKLNTEYFSNGYMNGFDGELAVCGSLTAENLCSDTTSAMGTIEGEVPCHWCVFDMCLPGMESYTYFDRYMEASKRVKELLNQHSMLVGRLSMVPYQVAQNEEEARQIFEEHAKQGYEGSILRDPKGLYKFGRCTGIEANYMRYKAFADAEIKVTQVLEGQSNMNELKEGEFGQAERSTHAANMVPNGMVGTIVGTLMQNIVVNGKLFLPKGSEVTVAPGKMTHDQRVYYWNKPEAIEGKIVKFKYFPINMKDKLRFPTFQCFRSAVDL